MAKHISFSGDGYTSKYRIVVYRNQHEKIFIGIDDTEYEQAGGFISLSLEDAKEFRKELSKAIKELES